MKLTKGQETNFWFALPTGQLLIYLCQAIYYRRYLCPMPILLKAGSTEIREMTDVFERPI